VRNLPPDAIEHCRMPAWEWVTHGQSQSGGGGESGIMDVYTTFPWSTLCEQVLCVKIDLLEGKVIEMPRLAAASAHLGPVGEASARLTGTRSGTRAANDSESEERDSGAYRIRKRWPSCA